MTSTSHLKAIMFTDIVGYTTLMQADRNHAISIARKHESIIHELVAQFNGSVINFYGDGSLCLFDTASAALECARQIQLALKTDVPLRIGIHDGEVTIEDGKAYGDGVNIASRIESSGYQGTILYSKSIQDKIKNTGSFHSHSVGTFQFKNVAAPMEIFALKVEGTPSVDPSKLSNRVAARSTTKRNRAVMAILVVVLLVSSLIAINAWNTSNADVMDVLTPSIAVLPFDNLGSDDDLYFTDGLAEDLLTQLSKVAELTVLSSFTLRDYNSDGKTPKEIGEELNVNYLLTGIVRRADDRLHVNYELIKTSNQQALGSWPIDRDESELFVMQSTIAFNVANTLGAKLTTQEESRIAYVPTDNLVAYNLYMKGREEYNKRNPSANETAKNYFNSAIGADSNLAVAWAGLSDATVQSVITFRTSPREALDTAFLMAEKAVSLDSESAEAWKALGTVYAMLPGQTGMAISSLRTALLKNPNHYPSMQNLANLMRRVDNPPEAIGLYERIIQLNPLQVSTYGALASTYDLLQIYDLAKARIKTAMELEPDNPNHLIASAEINIKTGAFDDAMSDIEKYVSLAGPSIPVFEWAALRSYYLDSDRAMYFLESAMDTEGYDPNYRAWWIPIVYSYLLMREGHVAVADSILSTREAFHLSNLEERGSYPDAVGLIKIYAIKGNITECLKRIESTGHSGRGLDYRWYEIEPMFEAVRSDPRYLELAQGAEIIIQGWRDEVIKANENELDFRQ